MTVKDPCLAVALARAATFLLVHVDLIQQALYRCQDSRVLCKYQMDVIVLFLFCTGVFSVAKNSIKRCTLEKVQMSRM